MKGLSGRNRIYFLWPIGFMLACYGNYVFAEGKPVALWHCDETNGTALSDSSGNGITGTLHNVAWQKVGLLGSCLKFGGTSNYVELTHSIKLDFGTGDFTIELWVNIDSTVTNRSFVIGNGHAWGSGKIMWWVSNVTLKDRTVEKRLLFTTGKWNPAGKDFTDLWVTFPSAGLDKWTHIALVRKTGALYVYIDGVQMDAKAGQWSKPSVDVSGGDWMIGADSGKSEYFKGEIDEVAVYNYARSAKQIQEDANDI